MGDVRGTGSPMGARWRRRRMGNGWMGNDMGGRLGACGMALLGRTRGDGRAAAMAARHRRGLRGVRLALRQRLDLGVVLLRMARGDGGVCAVPERRHPVLRLLGPRERRELPARRQGGARILAIDPFWGGPIVDRPSGDDTDIGLGLARQWLTAREPIGDALRARIVRRGGEANIAELGAQIAQQLG